ncbi:MAG TPA: NRDE family protein [Anaeromyxobacteraceae bacterium]|nr:NRDE family protein [Anaeromyxobacteraceae bacterium]
MCTLAVAWRTDRRWPLVVAANRDERLGRPSEGWELRQGRAGTRWAGPLDVKEGGTWMGVAAGWVFAGITNYHAPAGRGPDPGRRSRGELVTMALDRRSAAEARAALTSVDPARYNPFHLLVADRRSAFLWWYDGEASALHDLGPGLHVVTENSPYGRCPRGDFVRSRWLVDASVPRLREMLSSHSETPGTSVCVHLDPHYGTRSSAALRLADSLASSELYAADGRPCETPLLDRSGILADLARSA